MYRGRVLDQQQVDARPVRNNFFCVVHKIVDDARGFILRCWRKVCQVDKRKSRTTAGGMLVVGCLVLKYYITAVAVAVESKSLYV